jgi:hypothetical protein
MKRKNIFVVVATTVSIMCIAWNVTFAANITNIEAKENLESLNDIGCTSFELLRNTYTPADLYRGTAECVRKNDLDSAVFMSALAGVYGRYDAFRVSDQTARQAASVVQMKYMGSLSDDEKKQFMARLSAVAGSAEKLVILCKKIRNISAPNYHPAYMIQHGMNAFVGGNSNSGLVQNFDSSAAWEKALDSYLHCPMS